ncbi:piggyBac transposable element-derived protein 4-like [Diretmus argenteus]
MPRRPPGPQVDALQAYSPKDLFMLYFTTDMMKTLCTNTNRYAALNQERGKKYKWIDVDVEELAKFLGLSLPSLPDYWRTRHIMTVPFPASVMARDRFSAILWNIHLSDPEEDIGRPLYDDIRDACKAHYHPRRALSVDERMVATKAKTGMSQLMKDKPTRWGIKLFMQADAENGYTIDFNVYHGKSDRSTTDFELSYDAVMDVVKPAYLGTGYHVYVDNFYTSPKLFLDLASLKFGACGTYRENRKGVPRDRANALTKKSVRGSIRWIREGSLVFVKWMDTREVSVCSTIHPAVTVGDTVERRARGEDGSWRMDKIPCPTPILAYNKNMGGVDLSDQLLQYYTTHRRSDCWYRTLFFHFVDIATTNAYIMHRDITDTHQAQHKSHKDFQAELVSQLCGVEITAPANRKVSHVPVPCPQSPERKPRTAAYSARSATNNNQREGPSQSGNAKPVMNPSVSFLTGTALRSGTPDFATRPALCQGPGPEENLNTVL